MCQPNTSISKLKVEVIIKQFCIDWVKIASIEPFLFKMLLFHVTHPSRVTKYSKFFVLKLNAYKFVIQQVDKIDKFRKQNTYCALQSMHTKRICYWILMHKMPQAGFFKGTHDNPTNQNDQSAPRHFAVNPLQNNNVHSFLDLFGFCKVKYVSFCKARVRLTK